MKRLMVMIVAFGLGLAGAATIRFHQHWQRGFQRGYAVAASRFQQEAVRNGHGHWERAGNGVAFQWNTALEHYHPESPATIPGLR
ncbi:MAG TPA: hypothetical protein VM510_16395 [Caulifigura sp.]|nr:hypothetical protein [Caulifigura sp.]